MTNGLKRLGRVLLWILAALAGLAVIGLVVGFFVIRGLVQPPSDQFGNVEDEAKRAGRTVDSFPGAADPDFARMDRGLLLPPAPGQPYPPEIMEVAAVSRLEPEEVRQAALRGQNMWIVWTGGNDRFWDYAARTAIGSFDLLKIVSSHPSQAYGRYNRFRYLGLMNEPCFTQPTQENPARFGLWLDTRNDDCPADSFADAAAYPGVKIPAERLKKGEVDARGEPTPLAELYPASTEDGALPVGSYYGEPTGVVGLRLFPNPEFDAEAAAHWDPEKFYTDADYYNDKTLVRPYRVGMSCAFCHVGPNPLDPPDDVENPTWSEMTSNPGAQYFWVDRIFFWNTAPRDDRGVPAMNEGNFLYQIFHTNPPGSLDTSLVSTDYMNNPRTMNAVYEVGARLGIAGKTGIETLQGGERDNRQFQDFPQTAALAALFDEATGKGASMRVLKDGADSVGTLGALNRVYLNIGLFSEEWLLHFRPFLGGQKISPIEIANAQKNSVFWQATEAQSADMAIFFLVAARADRLKDAPGGAEILAAQDADLLDQGKVVFADTCAACHSSKQPDPDPVFGVDSGVCEGGGTGPEYRQCWDRFWAWAQSDTFKRQMRDMVRQDNFLEANYLSTERRVPLDLLGTNACSAVATNGLKGDIWDNFTSSTYKSLPPPGEVTVHHPVSGAAMPFQSLGNGRGYLRPASLVSLWTSAPYLLNNSVGYTPYPYTRDYYAPAGEGAYGATQCPNRNTDDPFLPCVENRVAAFDSSIRKLLDPSTRRMDQQTTEPVPGYIYRTSAPSCLVIPPGFTPDIVQTWSGTLTKLAPWAVTPEGAIALGPFPEGFPINALTNTKLLPDNDEPDMLGHMVRLGKSGPALIGAFKQLGGQCSAEQMADPGARAHSAQVVAQTGLIDTLVGLSKCPDYVVNRGHDFGAPLSDPQREALIAYLMHF
ncbi:MAG: hypothetical protein CML65_10325 [Rhodobacteraceae bacterium]|nr:hypothetical protein [Paracoccaceae bacterium]